MSHIWMQHTEHHGKAEIPAEAADMWALKGWVPCEAPVDADPAMVEHQSRPVSEPVDESIDEPSTENTEEH